MSKLFLICPECFLENAIRNVYGKNNSFLTALGTVFDSNDFEFAEEVNGLITNEGIHQIYILNDFNCTFIKNIINGGQNLNTKAEEVLRSLFDKHEIEFNDVDDLTENTKVKLAKLNIHQQAKELLELAFIGNKIRDNEIELIGVIYDRKLDEFDEFII